MDKQNAVHSMMEFLYGQTKEGSPDIPHPWNSYSCCCDMQSKNAFRMHNAYYEESLKCYVKKMKSVSTSLKKY